MTTMLPSPVTTQILGETGENVLEDIFANCKVQITVVVLVAKSCPTLRDPMDYSPPDSSVHGISQARILEWVAISWEQSSQMRSE